MTSGTAYALADRRIGPHLPFVKSILQSPAGVSMISRGDLARGPDSTRDPYWSSVAATARGAGIRSVVKITGRSSAEAAATGRAVVNQFYQTDAYRPGDPFVGGIVYQKGGKPVEDTGTFYSSLRRN
ncbi:MAG: hypothetical protein HYT72_03305 [Candidatus Aenigmarchaeota archaeon]|nr:hypothetical protein [Candidatus Aenigmarchaeota archaeon]